MDEQAKAGQAQHRFSTYELAGLNQKEGEILGFVNGCFDPLHAGHIRLLARARLMCDRLVVAINDDHSVATLKGRNALRVESRRELLGQLVSVDGVIVFGGRHPGHIIRDLRPSLIFKGMDYAQQALSCQPEYEDIMRVGATVVLLPLLCASGYGSKLSSSDMVRRAVVDGGRKSTAVERNRELFQGPL